MKKFIALLLCLVFALTTLAACNTDADTDNNGENKQEENTENNQANNENNETLENDENNENGEENNEELQPPKADPINPASLTANKSYTADDGSILLAYEKQTAETYEGVCVFYEDLGFTLYGENQMASNLFSTYTKDSTLVHTYWIEAHNELNIITSETGAETIPPRTTELTGDFKTSVTQLQQKTSQTSGMAYIIQLADGSFIIYDGGYADTTSEMFNTLRNLAPSKNSIHIRAWLITHSHDDHYSCFSEFSKNVFNYKARYSCEVTLDHLLISPVNDNDALRLDSDGNYLSSTVHEDIKKFSGAKIAYVYTGMEFTYGNMNLEILFAPNELFIDGNPGYFNETSIISRVYSNQPENGDTMSMIFLGDAGKNVANRLMVYYGEYLRSDMCQISHHGVEDFPLLAYQMIKSSILFYPCNTSLYNLTNRDADVRKALRESSVTKEILLRDDEKYIRYFNPTLNEK